MIRARDVSKVWLTGNLSRSYQFNVAFEFVLVVVIALFFVSEGFNRSRGWIETIIRLNPFKIKGVDHQVKNSRGERWIWLKNELQKIYQFERDFPALACGVFGLVWASDFLQKLVKI